MKQAGQEVTESELVDMVRAVDVNGNNLWTTCGGEGEGERERKGEGCEFRPTTQSHIIYTVLFCRRLTFKGSF
jgi:hypothetical protein